MICHKGHWVYDGTKHEPGHVICPTCARERSEKGLREIQTEFLKKALRGDFGYCLLVTKGKAHAQKHAIMFTTKTRAFCGKEFDDAPQTTKLPYDIVTLDAMCPLCRSEIAHALNGVAG